MHSAVHLSHYFIHRTVEKVDDTQVIETRTHLGRIHPLMTLTFGLLPKCNQFKCEC